MNLKIGKNIYGYESEYIDINDFMISPDEKLFINKKTGEFECKLILVDYVNFHNYTELTGVTWTSSDSNVVSVDSNGYILPKKQGEVIITASLSTGESATTKVVVPEKQQLSIGCDIFNPVKEEVFKGNDIYRIAGYINSYTEIDPFYDLKSLTNSNENVIRFSEDTHDYNELYFEIVGFGESVITGELHNGSVATYKIIVVPPKEIHFTDDSVEIKKGKSEEILFYDEDGDEYSIADPYEIENLTPDIIEIDGLEVTAINYGVGEYIIKAPNNVSASIKIIVPAPNGIKLGIKKGCEISDLELKCGYEENLFVFDDENKEIESKCISWTSSNEDVVKVDYTGKIEAVKCGEAVISAKVVDLIKSVKITVPNIDKIKVKYKEQTRTNDSGLYVFDSNDEIIPNKCIKFTSSDEDIFKVYENGEFEVLKDGQGEITVTLSNGVTTSINFSVPLFDEIHLGFIKQDRLIDLSNKQFELPFSYYTTLFPMSDEDVIPFGIKWSSSNENVVTINKYGKIKAVGFGKAIISATYVNGVEASIEVIVPEIKKIKILANIEILKKRYEDKALKLNKAVKMDSDALMESIFQSELSDMNIIVNNNKLMVLDENGYEILDGITWTTSNNDLIIDEEGVLHLRDNAEGTFTATLINGVSDSRKVVKSIMGFMVIE